MGLGCRLPLGDSHWEPLLCRLSPYVAWPPTCRPLKLYVRQSMHLTLGVYAARWAELHVYIRQTYLLCQWPDPWWDVQQSHRQPQQPPGQPWADTPPPSAEGWAPWVAACTACTEGPLSVSRGKPEPHLWSSSRWNYSRPWWGDLLLWLLTSARLKLDPGTWHESDAPHLKRSLHEQEDKSSDSAERERERERENRVICERWNLWGSI